MITAFTGIRDLHVKSVPDVELAVFDACGEMPKAMIFGGARGSDTVALRAAFLGAAEGTELRVVVPFDVASQPTGAREAITLFADAVEEMGLPRVSSSYLRRNDRMLAIADRLVAFWDGSPGGTQYTVERAPRGMPVSIIEVARATDAETVANPRTGVSEVTSPTFHLDFSFSGVPCLGLGWYRSIQAGPDFVSDFARGIKVGGASQPVIDKVAAEAVAVLAAYLLHHAAIVPMPRRTPGIQSDLAPLVAAIAARTGKIDGTGWLTRVVYPKEGAYYHRRRVRFPRETHRDSMRYTGSAQAVMLVDNVFTTGGTFLGAVDAILRDRPGTDVFGFFLAVAEV